MITVMMKPNDRVIITGKARQFGQDDLVMKKGTFVEYIIKGGIGVVGLARIKLDEPPKGYPTCLEGFALVEPEVLGKLSDTVAEQGFVRTPCG